MFRTSYLLALALSVSALAAPANVALAQRPADVAGPSRDLQTQPQRRTRPLREGVTGLGQNQDVIREPRFMVEAVNFHAVDESGPNSPGADEVFAIFEAGGQSMLTSVVEEVETGEMHEFDTAQRCILPAQDLDGARNDQWSCAPSGAPGPVQFTIALYELDPDYRGELAAFFGQGFEVCLGGPTDVLAATCVRDHSDLLFRHTFNYGVSEILMRLDPACRCFTETVAYRQTDWRGDSDYQVTIRITRVDDGRDMPAVDRNADTAMPIVYRNGMLSARPTQGLDFDAGAIALAGADLVFTRTLVSFQLTPSGGGRIWVGDATPRGYATCYAQRQSANYLTTPVALPAIGSHACYLTSDGRVGELRIASLTGSGDNAILTVAYTTWQ